MGRHSRAEAPSVAWTIRCSPAERDRIDEAAKANHQTISQFSRDVIMDAAEQCLTDPPLRQRQRARMRRRQDRPLSTNECAAFMGLTTEWIRCAILEGVSMRGAIVKLGAESFQTNRRRVFRVYFAEFVIFLRAIGWSHLPTRAG